MRFKRDGDDGSIEATFSWQDPASPKEERPAALKGPALPGAFKPTLHDYRVDAWTGKIVDSRPWAIPGH